MEAVRLYTDEYNFIKINDINFCLDGKTKGFLKSRLQKIQDELPHNSTIILDITKEMKDDYEYFFGSIKINTFNNKCSAEACHLAIKNLFISLEKDVSRHIKQWKKNRFNKNNFPHFELEKLTGGYA